MFGSLCCCGSSTACELAGRMKIMAIPGGLVYAGNCSIFDYECLTCQKLAAQGNTPATRPNAYPYYSNAVAKNASLSGYPDTGFIAQNNCSYGWSVVVQSFGTVLTMRMMLHLPQKIKKDSIVLFSTTQNGSLHTVYKKTTSVLAGYNNSETWEFSPSEIVMGGDFGCGTLSWSVQGDFNPLP